MLLVASYVFYGGNRKGSARTARNLMITMRLGGLWHWAAMPFVIWGAFHGVCLIVHRALAPTLERMTPIVRCTI
jgi:alginate O-acetyltransferase complex protein AlgI